MADRQSSSHNSVSRSNESYNNRREEPSRPRETPRFDVTNHFDGHEQPARVVFCKYNPLHVVATSRQEIHERRECPDRTWNPGEKIVKYNDLN